MADPIDDGKSWLGIPDRIWNLVFISIATAVVSYFSNRTKLAVDEHAAVAVAHQEEIKTQVNAVQAKVTENGEEAKTAIQEIPQATATAVVEAQPKLDN